MSFTRYQYAELVLAITTDTTTGCVIRMQHGREEAQPSTLRSVDLIQFGEISNIYSFTGQRVHEETTREHLPKLIQLSAMS